MSWWRRNRAALLAAPVVLAAAGWMTGADLVGQWRDERAAIALI